jgi:hypothetical protein
MFFMIVTATAVGLHVAVAPPRHHVANDSVTAQRLGAGSHVKPSGGITLGLGGAESVVPAGSVAGRRFPIASDDCLDDPISDHNVDADRPKGGVQEHQAKELEHGDIPRPLGAAELHLCPV